MNFALLITLLIIPLISIFNSISFVKSSESESESSNESIQETDFQISRRIEQTSSESLNSLNTFISWLSSEKCTLHPYVKIAGGKTGELHVRGLYSKFNDTNGKEMLKEGTIITSIPLNSILSIEHVVNGIDDISKAFNKEFDKLTDIEVMSTYLALIRIRNSKLSKDGYTKFDISSSILNSKNDLKYSSYIDSLPFNFDSLPIFWSSQEILEAQNTSIVELRKKRINAAIKTYNSDKFTKFKKLLTFNEYLWGLSIILSRTHSIKVRVKNNKKWISTSVLIPLADMLNTGLNDQINTICLTNELSSEFICKLTKNITKSGTQLLTEYSSNLSNIQLLNDYGLTIYYQLQENNNDYVILPIKGVTNRGPEFDSSESLSIQLQLMTSFNFSGSNTEFILYSIPFEFKKNQKVTVESVLTKELMQFTRILSIDKTQLILNSKQDFARLFYSRMSLNLGSGHISIKNEELAMNLLIEIIKEKLHNYPTTIEQDFQRMESELDFTMQHIIHLRIIEKNILSDAIDTLEQYIKTIHNLKQSEIESSIIKDDKTNVKPLKINVQGDREDDPIPYLRKGQNIPSDPPSQIQLDDDEEDEDLPLIHDEL